MVYSELKILFGFFDPSSLCKYPTFVKCEGRTTQYCHYSRTTTKRCACVLLPTIWQ
jgi:hypothetical protein